MACTRVRVLGAYRQLLAAGRIAFAESPRSFDDYRRAVRTEFGLQADETDPEVSDICFG